MGRASPRPAKLDHTVGAILSQVGGQVDAQSMQLGKVLALVGILAGAKLQPKLRLESLLLALKSVLSLLGPQLNFLLPLVELELVGNFRGLLVPTLTRA